MWLAFRAVFPKHSKGYEKLKLANVIGEKLESVSTPMEDKKDEGNRELTSLGSVIYLTHQEYDTLKKMLGDDEIGWSYTAGKEAQATMDWLEGCKLVEMEETTPK